MNNTYHIVHYLSTIFHNVYNNSIMRTNLTSKEQVKIIIAREALTAQKLADALTEKTGKKYTRQSIAHRISQSSFNYDEVKDIADIYGYEITINKQI